MPATWRTSAAVLSLLAGSVRSAGKSSRSTNEARSSPEAVMFAPVLSEIRVDEPYPFPHLSAIAPLFRDGRPNAESLGAVILVSDVRESLYPLLQSWPTLSASGEVLLIRRIRDLLYEQGFTINGARHRLETEAAEPRAAARATTSSATVVAVAPENTLEPAEIRQELEEIRQLLSPS